MTDTEIRFKAAALLRSAAAVMLKGGYVAGRRGPVATDDAPHCALGAMDRVARQQIYGDGEGRPDHQLARKTLAEIVRPQILDGTIDHANTDLPIEKRPKHSSIIACWNNMVAGSAEKVAACMNAAAEILEAQNEADNHVA